MSTVQVYSDPTQLAEAAAYHAAQTLNAAIQQYGGATWLLAGGSTPLLAYRYVAGHYLNAIDWSKVTFAIGDERIGALDGPENNWHAIEQALLAYTPQAMFLRPATNQGSDLAVDDYTHQLALLPKTPDGAPRFDLVWLGVGDDGHTMSLFPNHSDFHTTKEMVEPVHVAPKPPAERISLTLYALRGAQTSVVLASGLDKTWPVQQALRVPTSQLPIAYASRLTNAIWLIDKQAAGV